MNEYTKGINLEEPDTFEKLGITGDELTSTDTIAWINGSSNAKTMTENLAKELKIREMIVVSGVGPSIKTVITIVESIKRKHFAQRIYQYTRLTAKKVEEMWEPKDRKMDEIVVVREIPRLSVLLSFRPISNCNVNSNPILAENKSAENKPAENKSSQKRSSNRRKKSKGRHSTSDVPSNDKGKID